MLFFYLQGSVMLENVMIQIVHSHVKNLDLIAAIPVMLLVMMVSFVHIVYKFGGKEIFVFTRKFVFIINYLMFY